MRRFISALTAMIMVITISVTAFATDINQDSSNKTSNTNITYTVNPSYTVTIPANVTLGNSITVSAEDVRVAKGSQVVVKLTGINENDNDFKVKTTEGAELTYTVQKGSDNVAINDVVLAVNPEVSTSGSQILSFIEPTNIIYAGNYTGNVTFKVSVESVSNP